MVVMLCPFSSKGRTLSSDTTLHGMLLFFSGGTCQQHLSGAVAFLTLSHVHSVHCEEIAEPDQLETGCL